MTDKSKEVEALIDKAANSPESGDALRFSQAALNAANAMWALRSLPKVHHPDGRPPERPKYVADHTLP